ncbi:dpm1 [Scenedesmus sp. PABB004]|nr:dpm1 [Scenedesmus sp. PABB004]
MAAAPTPARPGRAPPHGRVSIIVPTYNEAANVPILLWLIAEACGGAGVDWEVVVVDDASPDGTADAVAATAALLPPGRVRLRSRPGKLGLGSAYGHGLCAASGDWVVLMDADLSHHPKYIPELLAAQAASGADIVTGTRYAPGGGVSGWDWRRKLTSRGANVLASCLLGLSVSDLTGAFRLYRRRLLEALLPRVGSRGYAFQMEMIARATAAGAAIHELPIVFVDRLYGDSKLGRGEYALFAAGLARLLLTL